MWVLVVQQRFINITYKIEIEVGKKMMIVGQVSNAEEAKEIEFIAKSLVTGNRARILAHRLKKV